jgi:hypothetical protein
MRLGHGVLFEAVGVTALLLAYLYVHVSTKFQ